MISIFKGQHIKKRLVEYQDFMCKPGYIKEDYVFSYEEFYRKDLNMVFKEGDYINIKNDEVRILKIVYNLDGSIIYKTNKELSREK